MLLLFLAACTTKAAPVVTESPMKLDVGPLLGGLIKVSPPIAGDYRVRMIAERSVFLNREHTLREARDVSARLLMTEGRFQLCLWGTRSSESSRYRPGEGASDDQKNKSPVSYAVEGRWSGGVLQLERWAARCGGETQALQNVEELRCVVARSGKLQGSLLCTGRHPRLDDIGILSAGHERDGSWVLRGDPSLRKRIEFPADFMPWFVFGALPGLSIEAHNRRRSSGFEIQPARVPDPP